MVKWGSEALHPQPHLVKIGNDLIQQPQALDSLVVHLSLGVEVGEAWDGGEHDTYSVVGLGVQLLWGHTDHKTGFFMKMLNNDLQFI